MMDYNYVCNTIRFNLMMYERENKIRPNQIILGRALYEAITEHLNETLQTNFKQVAPTFFGVPITIDESNPEAMKLGCVNDLENIINNI